MDFIDKIAAKLNPEKALKRIQAQNDIKKLEAESKVLEAKLGLLDMLTDAGTAKTATNSGYSQGGASRRQTWAKKWYAESGSAKSDIEENRKLLRERSRDLFMNSPLGSGAVKSNRTSCVGMGLVPKPKIDYEFLNMSQEEAENLQKLIKKEFAIWAGSTLCDNNDQNNFYELQQIAFTDWLNNGEEFVLVKYADKSSSYMPYQLRIKLVEADRICTPGSYDGGYDGFDCMQKNGSRIMNGIEIDKDGKVAAYHISSQFPGEHHTEIQKWQRVEKRGRKTGNPNILHIFNAERADQYRGVPFLAPVIQCIKQLTRYTEAETMAAVINAIFGIFITTKSGNELSGFGGMEEEYDLSGKDEKIEVGTGTVTFLKEGEEVHAVESAHPSNNYDAFINSMALQIGAALEISPEVLLKKFTNSFSAAKGAINETWKAFKMRRKWFIDDFCQEIYVLWFNEAVSKGRIKAPGYFNNILIRNAYTNATWNGPAQGMLNPMQEVSAAVSRINEGLSTHEDECIALNGSDFDDNVRTLKNENAVLAEAKAAGMPAVKQEGGTDGKD